VSYTTHKLQSESDANYFYLLTFSFYFYGNNHITEFFKYFQSNSISHNCFAQQMAAPQLILMAEIGMWLQQQALIEFWLLKVAANLHS